MIPASNNPRGRVLSSAALRGAETTMFLPWYAFAQFAVECQVVIGLRVMRLLAGGCEAHDEAQLMVCEKLGAAIEATGMMMAGCSAGAVVAHYREHVAANSVRLLAPPV